MQVIDFTGVRVSAINRHLGIYTEAQSNFLENTSFWFSQIDRTGHVQVGPRCKILHPKPLAAEHRSFEENCNQRAQELIAEGKPMALYWSGGIDSTLALVSLLKAGVDTSQLTVVITSFSIAEYPSFYENYIKGKLTVRKVGASIYPYIRTDELIITGEHGDQIFGSDNAELYRQDFDQLFLDSWQDGFRRRTKDAASDAILEPLMQNAPFPIENAFDGFWWYNITCKWQHVALRMTSHLDDVPAYLAVARHFYATDAFQAWSMNETNHRTLKIRSTWNSYKFEAKRLIREFTGDTDYERDKLKIGSLPTYIVKPFLLLFEDYTRVSCVENMQQMVAQFDPEQFQQDYNINWHSLFSNLK